MNKICSSSSIKELTKLINEYFYSENYVIKDNKVVNLKTGKVLGVVKQKNGRYIYYY